MKGECSENEAKYKAEAYCSSTERCIADVEAKLEQWGATPDITEKVISHLVNERYIDQQRFCIAFIRDKYRFNQWGKIKISQALRLKKIPADLINIGMEEIDEQEYMEILSKLIEQKKKSIKARTEYERNGKLIRFAVGRGFEMEAILRCVKQVDCDDVYPD
ncbi:regulatory protein RecX [Phocaeicola sp.]